MTDGCPIIAQDGTAVIVDEAFDKYSDFAQKAYNLATDEITNLGSFTLQMLDPNVHFNVDETVYGFNRPAVPVLQPMVYNDPGTLPDAPSIPQVAVTFDNPPDAPPSLDMDLVDYAEPDAQAPDAPTDLPTPAPTAFDTTPLSLDAGPQPTLTLPTVPDPSILPPFNDPVPVPVPPTPNMDFGFNPTEYASDLLTKVRNQISFMLDGGTGLPASTAQALRDRANAAVDVEETRQVQQATEEYAAMGWEEPPGVLKKRVMQVRQDALNKRSALNRDIFIQEQTVAIDNLRFAVTTGVGCEIQLLQGHNEFMRISMDALRISAELGISLFNAQVALYNGEQQANAILASIARDRGQQAIDFARLQLDAQRARDEISEQQWLDGLRALEMQADVYRANLLGQQAVAASKSDDNRALLDRFRAELELFGQKRSAYVTEWDNWTRKWSTNEMRAKVVELAQAAFDTQVRAWSTSQTTKIAEGNFTIAQGDMTLRVWRAKVDEMLAKYQAERDRLGSLLAIAQEQVALYTAQAGVEETASNVNLRALTAAIEQEKARVDTELKNAEISINEMIENARLMVSAKDVVARTAAQLAASSMSAVNFSAGISSSLSQRYGCTTSFDYSGAIDAGT